MKKVFLALSAIALLGGGCSGSNDGDGGIDASTTAPVAAYQPVKAVSGNTPGQEAQTSYVQLVYAVDANSCEGFKNFFSASLKSAMTQGDCDAAFSYMKANYIPIDWDNAKLSKDGNTITVNTTDGELFANFSLEDGYWLMNTTFWVK